MNRADVAVVGAGIVGLACARSAARRGNSVVLFDRSPRAQGASVRNFGMVWPVGQAPGKVHQRALKSRDIWLEIAAAAGIWCEAVGSLHLAYKPDEWAVLGEFDSIASDLGYEVELLGPADVARRSSAVQTRGLLGGMWSASELCVDPREAIARLPLWLAEAYGVTPRFGSVVTGVGSGYVETAQEKWQVSRTVVCTGADFQELYPDLYAASGMSCCKLQMMRTRAQPDGWRLGPHLAGGLTLRHYAAFEACLTLSTLRSRVSLETPDFDRWGIHVMASQTGVGEITIGDSHEYGDDISPFDRAEIDELILDYLRGFLVAPDLQIAERWHGIYAKHPSKADFVTDAAPEVKIVNGVGGAGMTTSFGLAEEVFDSWS